jgi:hypothetical protein
VGANPGRVLITILMRKLIISLLVGLASWGLVPAFGATSSVVVNNHGATTLLFTQLYVADANPCTMLAAPQTTVASGGTVTITVNSGYHFLLRLDSGSCVPIGSAAFPPSCPVSSYPYLGSGVMVEGADATIDYCSGATTNCQSLQILNQDSVPRMFQIQSNNMGLMAFNMATIATVTLNPGAAYSKDICSTDTFQLQACRAPVGNSDGSSVIQQALGNCDMMYFSSSESPGVFQPVQKADNTATNGNLSAHFNGDQSNIAFFTNSAAATEGTLKSGFSALYDEASKVGTTLHTDLQGLGASNSMGQLDADLNAFKFANHNDLSNGFAGLHGSGDASWTNQLFGTHHTDASTMWGDAQSGPLAPAAATMQSWSDTAKSASDAYMSSGGDGGGAGFSYTIHAGTGGDFHFGPDGSQAWSMMTSCAEVSRKILTWLAVVGYLLKVAQDIFRVVRMFALSKGAIVPNLEFTFAGIGGNMAGVALYLLVLIAGLAIWAVWLGVMLAGATGGSTDLGGLLTTAAGNPTTGMNSGGLALVEMFVPLGLVFGLVMAYLAWRMSVSKLVLLFSAFTKALVGW